MFFIGKTKKKVLNMLGLHERRFKRLFTERRKVSVPKLLREYATVQKQLAVSVKLMQIIDKRIKLLEQRERGQESSMTASVRTDEKGESTGVSMLVNNVQVSEKQDSTKEDSNRSKVPVVAAGSSLSEMWQQTQGK